MSLSQLEPDLLDHLRVEFGRHGHRAAEYLDTAARLLDSGPADVSRFGELVAYCIREALKEIPRASGVGPDRNWRRLSRDVVSTFDRFSGTVWPPDEDSLPVLAEHQAAVEELRNYHEEGEGVHQKRLVSLMIKRAGVEPMKSGTTPVADYQKLINDADEAAHSQCSTDDARELWERCVALMHQLFNPLELRIGRLVQLSRNDEPTGSDLGEVLKITGTPVHVKRFLREISSPRWLQLFSIDEALGDPGSDLWWAACSAAIRLSDSHQAVVVSWLIAAHDEYPENVEHARCFARAAHRVGGEALDLLQRIVRRFPQDDQIVHVGTSAARELEASHPLVQQLADVLLNESSWDLVMIADGLAAHLADGVDAQNAVERIGMLCNKLARIPEDDVALGRFKYESSGLVADAHTVFPHDRSSVLLGCLTTMLLSAWEWHPPEALLEAIEVLHPPLRDRLRAWVLASAPEADPDALAAEVEQAITGRDATGDDVALVDRTIEICGPASVEDRWAEALGPAPSVIEVSRVLGSDDLAPREWFRASSWEAVLPSEIVGPWAAPCRVMAGKYGELTRDDLLQGSTVESYDFESPYTADELNSMSPAQAAYKIAHWRPDPSRFHVSALYLARALKESIKHDPSRWLADPLGVATVLRHPVYISHYLGAARDCPGIAALHLDGLFDVIALVEGEPWSAEDLDDKAVKYPSWRNAQYAAVDLIAALIRADVTLGERADEVWDYLSTAARDLSSPPWESPSSSRASDIGIRAINRTSTRALDTAVLFADQELRAARPLRPELQALLDFALRLDGTDGAEYRSILAPSIPWLRRVMPGWTEANLERIYGSGAPDDLGPFTFDVTIQRGRVDDWLLETHLNKLQDAAARGIPYALQHVLAGMLRRCAGYESESVATYLRQNPDLGQQASGQLAFLLRGKDIEAAHLDIGTELWRALIASASADTLTGFGRMSQVTALDDDLWAKLTLETLSATAGQIDWHNQVADRAMTAPVTITQLCIVKQIVQGQSDAWTLRRIADRIEEFFDAASELRDTVEFSQLRTALQERDLID